MHYSISLHAQWGRSFEKFSFIESRALVYICNNMHLSHTEGLLVVNHLNGILIGFHPTVNLLIIESLTFINEISLLVVGHVQT